MTVKQWLNRAKRLDSEINTLIDLKKSISDRLTSITQNYDSDGSQSTKDPHKFDRLVEINNEIDKKLDALRATQDEIFNAINLVDDSRYRQILMGRYIGGWTWERIALAINYSYPQTVRLHGSALLEVKKCIPLNYDIE